MKTKIRNFVYHNDAYYSSFDSLKYLFICVFLFLSIIVGVFAVVDGLWWGLCILLALDIIFLVYLIILKRIKKTYILRFLSEGISSTLLSILFLSSAYIVLFATNCNTPGVTYAALFSYLLFVVMYIIFTIRFSKSNIFQNAHATQKEHTLFVGSLIPFSGIIGILMAKMIFKNFDFKNQVVVYIFFVIFVIISLLFSLGFSNYIKYIYCIKYKIFCDEYGESTSPMLERQPKMKKAKNEKVFTKQPKKKLPLVIKILIGIVSVPIVFLVISLIVSFIKGFVQGLS